MNPDRPHFDRDALDAAARWEEVRRLGADQDPLVRSLLAALQTNPEDPELRAFLSERLVPYRLRALADPDPLRPYPGPDSGLDRGDLRLGVIRETGLPWSLELDRLPHIAVLGPTGAGKTNALCLLLRGVHGRLPCLCLTHKPQDARLLVDPPVLDRAYRFEELRLNLFVPPRSANLEAWQDRVLDLVARAYLLQYSRADLQGACRELRDLYVARNRSQGGCAMFTLAELSDRVRARRSKYAASAAAALDALRLGLAPVTDCAQGYDPEDLFMACSALLDLGRAADDRSALFFTNWLLEWVHTWLDLHGPCDGGVRFLHFLDDAHRFLRRGPGDQPAGEISHYLQTVREAGQRIVAVSQCPAELAPAVLSQAGLILQVGALVHSRDLQTVGDALGLDPDARRLLQRLGRGEFAARENLGRCDRAFAGVVDPFPEPARPFTEADRRAIMEPFLRRLSWTPPLHLASSRTAAPARRAAGGAGAAADRLAMDVLVTPFDFLAARYRRLGLAGGAAQRAKQELVDRGWVVERAVPRRGKPPLLLEPLPALAAAFNQAPPGWGKGGFLHRFIVHTVRNRFLALGYTGVAVERFYQGKGVDLVATSPGGALEGVEATLSPANVVDNLEKDFLVQPRFACIHVVCIDQDRVRQVQRRIAAAPGLQPYRARIRTAPVADYLDGP